MPVVTVPAKSAPPVVDTERHRWRLIESGPAIRDLVALLVRLRAMLRRISPDSPLRSPAEAAWEAMAGTLYGLLREAYGHLALLATVDTPSAWQTWDAMVGAVTTWQAAGLDDLMTYWRERREPPHHLTHQDFLALRQARIPADFDPTLLLGEVT